MLVQVRKYENGKNYGIVSFIICPLHQILLSHSIEGGKRDVVRIEDMFKNV